MKLVLKLALLVLVAQDIAICGAKQSIVHRSSGSNVDYNVNILPGICLPSFFLMLDFLIKKKFSMPP